MAKSYAGRQRATGKRIIEIVDEFGKSTFHDFDAMSAGEKRFFRAVANDPLHVLEGE